MSVKVLCVESGGRPERVSVSLKVGEDLSLWRLRPAAGGGEGQLRSILLRRGMKAPMGAEFLFSAELETSPRLGLRVVCINPDLELERLYAGGRGMLEERTELESGSKLQLSLGNAPSIRFSLKISGGALESLEAAGGLQVKTAAGSSLGRVYWVIPAARSVLVSPLSRVMSAIQGLASRLGLSPGLVMMFMAAGVVVATSLAAAWNRHQAAASAHEQALQAQSVAEQAMVSQHQAQAGELACLSERANMAQRVDDLSAKRRIAAEQALSLSAARSVSTQLGGERMQVPSLEDFDRMAAQGTLAAVVARMEEQPAPSSAAQHCLEQATLLSQEPSYLLLWHPDESLVCPEHYSAIQTQVDWRGRWGLSERLAMEFGPSKPEDGVDLRVSERWSSAALIAAHRAARQAILSAPTRADRPPVSPGQVELWALLVVDGYNRMPTTQLESATLQTCTRELVHQIDLGTAEPERGQPVLPAIPSLISGEAPALIPVAGCPWSSSWLAEGAERVLLAAARQAQLMMTSPASTARSPAPRSGLVSLEEP